MVSFQDGGKDFKRMGGTAEAANRIYALNFPVSLQTDDLSNGPLPCFSVPAYGTIRNGFLQSTKKTNRGLTALLGCFVYKNQRTPFPHRGEHPLVFLLSCQNGSVSGVSSPLRSFAMMRHIRAVRVKGVMRYQPSQLGAARRARATERDSARASAGARSRPS